MEIIKFLDKTWQEIPEQDNPALGHIKTKDGLMNQECIIIFKGKYPLITNGGFVVAVNPSHGDIVKKGVFWASESAEFFAEALAVETINKETPEIFPGTKEALLTLNATKAIDQLKNIEGWLDHECALLGAVDGYGYNSGVEYGLRKASLEIRKRREAMRDDN